MGVRTYAVLITSQCGVNSCCSYYWTLLLILHDVAGKDGMKLQFSLPSCFSRQEVVAFTAFHGFCGARAVAQLVNGVGGLELAGH